DAGTQVDILARSTFLRYQEALGHVVDSIPEGYYPGDYLIVLGKELADRDGSKWSSLEESKWLPKIRSYAVNRLMKSIKDDLGLLGVEIDKYTSEHELVGSGKVEDVMKKLADKELIYKGVLERPKGKKSDDWEPRPQLLFKAKKFGDDVDRAIQKSDGSWTYFASDVAYHMDKFKRGYESMIDVWGADHGGYVQRMQAAVQAISDGKAKLDVKICQIVHLLQNGKPIRMSKRAGKFVTLADVVKAVGKDVVRFIMLSRRNDQVLEFDFDKVVAQSRENPVFYVQYAHARCCSVLRHAIEVFSEEALEPEALLLTDLSLLNDENELAVIKELASFPRVIESAAKAHEPHRLAFYLSDLAAAFHSLWNKGKDEESLRFILKSDVELTLARIALIRAIASVLAIGLGIMGIEPVREMKS
ncbi:MAG: arginine--tRNA ligase, partial [Rhodospirillaceae bacterium]|nr:arginine--tRNA ligase [Rhodospirillaceae bacterium]